MLCLSVMSREPRPEIPEPPLTPSLLQLAATKFNDFTVALLNGGKYAKQKTPAGGYLYHIADPAAINAWLGNEWKFGIVPGWPESLRESCLLVNKGIVLVFHLHYRIFPRCSSSLSALLICNGMLLA